MTAARRFSEPELEELAKAKAELVKSTAAAQSQDDQSPTHHVFFRKTLSPVPK
jgi:hypothetical protein